MHLQGWSQEFGAKFKDVPTKTLKRDARTNSRQQNIVICVWTGQYRKTSQRKMNLPKLYFKNFETLVERYNFRI